MQERVAIQQTRSVGSAQSSRNITLTVNVSVNRSNVQGWRASNVAYYVDIVYLLGIIQANKAAKWLTGVTLLDIFKSCGDTVETVGVF